MRALLLAAGLGTRLRPLTLTTPKCLVPIQGKPLLDYWLESLFSADIERVLINTHWLANVVRDHVARSPFRDRIDLVHEDELLGTGGTILVNRKWFGAGPFLVAHADNLTNFNVAEFVAAHEQRPRIVCPYDIGFSDQLADIVRNSRSRNPRHRHGLPREG